jgi:hypothetical protein
LNSGAAEKLRDKGLIHSIGKDEDGNSIYQIPINFRVNKDMVQAQMDFIRQYGTSKEQELMNEYIPQYEKKLGYAKKVSSVESRAEIITQAKQKLESFKANATPADMQLIQSLEPQIMNWERILMDKSGSYDPTSVLQAYASLERALGIASGEATQAGLKFKVAGEAGTQNMHPWATQLGNSIADYVPGLTVNSVFRTEEHNKAVGGKADSSHLNGAALDIRPEDWKKIPESTQREILDAYQAEAIDEGDHIHLEPKYKGVLKMYEESSIAERHNNPGNVKYAGWHDGGRWAKFPDMETGLVIQKKLLFDQDTVYSNMSVQEALKTYSRQEYDASTIWPEIADKKMSQLTAYQKNELIRRMLKKENKDVYQLLVNQGKI